MIAANWVRRAKGHQGDCLLDATSRRDVLVVVLLLIFYAVPIEVAVMEGPVVDSFIVNVVYLTVIDIVDLVFVDVVLPVVEDILVVIRVTFVGILRLLRGEDQAGC